MPDDMVGSHEEGFSREEKKKKKKKNRDREAQSDTELTAINSPKPSLDELGDGMPSLMSRKPLDLKRPSTSAVEDVRNALGVGSTSLPPVGRSHTPSDLGRLGTPHGLGKAR